VSPRACPAGYEHFVIGRAEAVAVPDLVPLVREVVANSTLYDWARGRPDAQALAGRQPAYAVPLPTGDGGMVVRHNRHGGLLGGITGDRFLYPTRAPLEFDLSGRLAQAGVPTPPMLAYVVYRSGWFARSDVVTRRVVPGEDLVTRLATNDHSRVAECLDFTATLLATIARAGARHEDLNAKNVLIGSIQAILLDVDRVTFGHEPACALALNLDRLERSLHKLRARSMVQVSDGALATLRATATARL